MADNTVTTSETPHQHAATPTPAAMKNVHTPSPAALAHTQRPHIPAHAGHQDQTALEHAESFGRVDDNGTVFVIENGTEREVGQFPDAPAQEALALYARRYLELDSKLDVFANRLKSSSVKPHEIDETIATLSEETHEPAVVGDIPALHQKFENVKNAATERRQQIVAARKEAVNKALAERTKIVEEAESIAAGLGTSTNWRNTASKFRTLFDQWQQQQRTNVRIDKSDADALWKRFSAARTKFNQERRKWAQGREAEFAKARVAKEAIIAEANEIKDSTDWGATSRQFNDLMARWKKSGHAGHSENDELWAQFRQACDTFYNARQAARDKSNVEEHDNLAKKEALLAQAEALLPVKTEAEAKQARAKLAEIQDQWDAIGYVPREDKARIENRLDAVDRRIKAVEDAAWTQTDPEADARKSSLASQITAQLSELDAQIAATDDPAKKSRLEAEKATKEQWLNAIR